MVRSGTCQHSICICHLELLRNRKNHLKRKRLVLFFVFFVGIYVEDALAEILTERYINRNLTFFILNVYPQSGRTSQSHGSPSICGGWIGWSGEETRWSRK